MLLQVECLFVHARSDEAVFPLALSLCLNRGRGLQKVKRSDFLPVLQIVLLGSAPSKYVRRYQFLDDVFLAVVYQKGHLIQGIIRLARQFHAAVKNRWLANRFQKLFAFLAKPVQASGGQALRKRSYFASVLPFLLPH